VLDPVAFAAGSARVGAHLAVERVGDGRYTIRTTQAPLYVGFDGDPDMHEMALLLPEPRIWNLASGAEGDTYCIAVPDTDMRLGMSLLRIYPPRIALAPDFGDRYQAWTFQKAG
jgi:hypothetical protein